MTVAPVSTCLPQVLEAAMLLCFGLAWPLKLLQMLRHRRPDGSLSFTLIIGCGYVAGAASKLALAFSAGSSVPPVFWLYLLNGLTVGGNALAHWHFSRAPRPFAPRQAMSPALP